MTGYCDAFAKHGGSKISINRGSAANFSLQISFWVRMGDSSVASQRRFPDFPVVKSTKKACPPAYSPVFRFRKAKKGSLLFHIFPRVATIGDLRFYFGMGNLSRLQIGGSSPMSRLCWENASFGGVSRNCLLLFAANAQKWGIPR